MENASGYADRLAGRITEHLQQGELPGVTWQTVEATSGMLKGLMGKKHSYLMVTSDSLQDYRMYVGMTLPQAARALDMRLVTEGEESEGCFYVVKPQMSTTA